jgi:glycosyltransferase involved in cell wall biosynthesis
MKKILILDLNGTSTVYTHYLAHGLKSEKIQVEILGKKKHKFLDIFDSHANYLGFNVSLKLLNYTLNWLWLLMNYKKYDLIIVQWLQLLKYLSLEVNLIKYLQKRTKILYIVHNVYPHNTKNKKIKKRYNSLYKKLDNIAVQTQKVGKKIISLNSDASIIRIEHGLFFKGYRERMYNDPMNKCLMVGYISKYKGIEDALEVVRELKKENESIYLEIIGFGLKDYIEKLNKTIIDYNIQNEVEIISKEVKTKFLIEKIKNSSMLWLPYKKISQSGVAYTSIGLGVPFIGYNVGNFKEAFGAKGVAEIVDRNNIEKFCEAVKKVKKENSIYRKRIFSKLEDDGWKNNRITIESLF